VRKLGLVLLLLTASVALAARPGDELIARLRAPCCWKQTLDVHASPIADQLRDEIHRRMAAGETEAAVEADVVQRYGERVRAIPNAGFLDPVGVVLLIAAAMGLIFPLLYARRAAARRREAEAAAAPAAPATPLEAHRGELARQLAELD
jgi:cytochrome c-type biogenesis protein CcmH